MPKLPFIPKFDDIHSSRDGNLSRTEIRTKFETIVRETCSYKNAEDRPYLIAWADDAADALYDIAHPSHKEGLTLQEYNSAIDTIEAAYQFKDDDLKKKHLVTSDDYVRKTAWFLWEFNYMKPHFGCKTTLEE
jgi:hypothetical protein